MPNYRRFYIPGGTYFFTIVTYQRQPIFANSKNISLFRKAVAIVKLEMPFNIIGAVVLPDHLHFISNNISCKFRSKKRKHDFCAIVP